MQTESLWIRSFPFKWPVSLITVGLCGLFCGVTFLLIATGASDRVWLILGLAFTLAGGLGALMGSLLCVWCVRKARRNPELFGPAREYEAETCISDATEIAR